MRTGAALVAITMSLTACGGGYDRRAPVYAPVVASSGPVAEACLTSGRPGADQSRCSCIQMAADQTLSLPDQSLGAQFFSDPAMAHEVRLSDTRRDDAFWDRWITFGETAENLCRTA